MKNYLLERNNINNRLNKLNIYKNRKFCVEIKYIKNEVYNTKNKDKIKKIKCKNIKELIKRRTFPRKNKYYNTFYRIYLW